EVHLSADYDQCPLHRTVAATRNGIDGSETIQNLSSAPPDEMLSQHPASGAPLISGSTRVDCGATKFVVDDARDAKNGDLQPGAMSQWPYAPARDGRPADLSKLPPDGEPKDRFGYCVGFDTTGWALITSPDLSVR